MPLVVFRVVAVETHPAGELSVIETEGLESLEMVPADVVAFFEFWYEVLVAPFLDLLHELFVEGEIDLVVPVPKCRDSLADWTLELVFHVVWFENC